MSQTNSATATNLEMLAEEEEKSTLDDYKELDDRINSVLEKISERKKKKTKK